MATAYLSLGSNLGDRRYHLAEAVSTLGDSVRAVSPVYETEPVGGPAQEAFLNIVVELETDLEPRELLSVCHRLESGAGRVRQERWGPRGGGGVGHPGGGGVGGGLPARPGHKSKGLPPRPGGVG